MKLCDYGCGQEAKHQLKNGKWCCSKSHNSCPTLRRKNIESHIGEKNHRYKRICSEETKKKISEGNKGNIPWNKNKTDIYSKETLELMSKARMRKIPYNKGIPCPEETKRKISKSLKGNIPYNKGVPCPEETKKKISKTNTGKKRSKEFKKIRSYYTSGNKNPNWKGGYHINNIAVYDIYAPRLTIEESPQRDKNDPNILTVLCTHCKQRFTPTLSAVGDRIRTLIGSNYGESRLYCSEECKKLCSIFNKSKYPKGFKDDNSREVQPELREMRLEIDNYTCQKCGKHQNELKNGLHCHHIEGIKWEPLESADLDKCITVCEDCHKKIHKIKGCSYHDMKCSDILKENII